MSMYCIEASSQVPAPISRGTGQPAGLTMGGAEWERGVQIANSASAAMSHRRACDLEDFKALVGHEMLKAFSCAARRPANGPGQGCG